MPKAKKMEAQPDFRVDKIAKHLLAIRRRMEEIQAAVKKQLVPFRVLEEKLQGQLEEWMDANGAQSIRTDEGTITIRITNSASIIADPDGFMAFVIENERFELIDRRANARACIDFAEETGKLPPGVKINSKRTLVITEPK